MSKPEKCDLPPNGWRCSRTRDHAGPCAARPAWWNVREQINGGWLWR